MGLLLLDSLDPPPGLTKCRKLEENVTFMADLDILIFIHSEGKELVRKTKGGES